jgi:dolichol-phosphate mannosyltransferase
MSADKIEISAVVPCFDEEEVIDELVRRLSSVLEAVTAHYEIVLVDDGSHDATWARICRLQSGNPHLVGVALSRNHGHQGALSAGLSLARGERVLILDADLQHPPELLPEMLAVMESEHADVVFGHRLERPGESWFKKVSARGFYALLSKLSGTTIPIDVGDFRLVSRRVIDVLNAMPEQQRFLRGMIPWIGFRQVPIDYAQAPRFAGKSHYPVRKMVRLGLDALTGFSVIPLRLATYLGFAVSVIAALLGLYAVLAAATSHVVSGWTSLMVVVLFLGGTQMLVIGVLGEYVGRIHDQSRNRPLFIIRDVVRSTEVRLVARAVD